MPTGTTSKKAEKTATGPTLKALQTKLRSFQFSFHDICDSVKAFDGSTTSVQFTVRLQQLEDIWENVSEAITDLEMHDEFIEEEKSFKERAEYGTRYFETKTLLMERLREVDEGSAINSSSRGLDSTLGPSTMEHVRLPQIKLQTFDGNIDEWLSFRDLYTSLIHWKSDLPDVEKFHYLKGCLAGEAKALIDPLALTRTNYQVAWETLTKRYNDSKFLKRRQVQALFKLPSIVKESGTELQSLLEGFERIVQTLDQLVQPADYKDLLLLDILCARLDPSTRRGWEEHSAANEQDTIKDLLEFLQRRVRVLGSLPSKSVEPKVESSQHTKNRKPFTRMSHSAVQAPGTLCVACSEVHPLYQCPTFQRMTVSVRDKVLQNHSLCRNCFRRGHQANDCTSRFLCRNCKAKHHTMVCFRSDQGNKRSPERRQVQRRSNREPTGEGSSKDTSSSSTAVVSSAAVVSSNTAAHRVSSVLLATAVVLVEDDYGTRYPARALLDSGSECNFMTERLGQLLKIQRRRSDIAVLGIGESNTRVKSKLEATIKSRVTGFSRKMEFLLLPKVTAHLPSADVSIASWKLPNGVELADPAFFTSKSVDMVLGIQHFFEFFGSVNKVELGTGLPALTESVFGWVVSGTIDGQITAPRISCNMAVSVDLEELLTRFWLCEEVATSNNYSPEEERCEEQYAKSVVKGPDGRYTVSLPKNEGALARMGESRDIAFRRLQGLERRLLREPELRQQYGQFMAEYQELGHMRKVNAPTEHTGKRCYLPHHPVIKQASTTTKVRVVFDASCKTSSGTSLNDALMVGPVIQDDLRSIILRCRTRQIMLVSDVEKMFRQINISPADMPLQSILWREDPKDEVGTYELTTVTYGTKPAPFLATRTIKQLALDEETRYPLAAKAATKDVYMDDVLTGADDVEKALELRIQLDQMMESGGFRLRKWASNCPTVLQGIPEENLALSKKEEIQLDPDPAVKTLGLVWLPRTDVLKFQFQIPTIDPAEKLSKRKVLSIIATLFDPLGLIGAVVTTAKIFMQQLWCLEDEKGKKLGWDQPLPSRVNEDWLSFHHQLPQLNELVIDRCVIIPEVVTVELHCFSDASERAYGACVYARSVDSTGAVRVELVASKSKVAPLKSQSIPRLELCGALLAAQLFEKILTSIDMEVKVYFWTDSTCVLQWLKAIPTTWTVFVANRVSKIQALTEHHPWNHVPGIENPADLISRGITPQQIKSSSLWWEGPLWLKGEQKDWPNQQIASDPEEAAKETRRSTVQCSSSQSKEFSEWYVTRFPGYSDMVRRTAYWLRLSKILRQVEGFEKANDLLTTAELIEAEYAIIRCVQKEFFPNEWKALSNKEAVARSSPIRWYSPQLSMDNLIRVGGRLGHSMESDETKHPILLPARHPLTRMLFERYHKQLLHAGPQLLLGTVRLKYWPLGGRNVARNVVHKCHRCFRAKPTPIQQFMGELPSARVSVSRPFSKVGVDYFGPVFIKQGPRRSATKAYVAVFVCMCTKAVHLELVTDLSTERFLQALRRFIARRGRCTDIYSDNGTNFVGARNYLRQLSQLLCSKEHNSKMSKECAEEGIYWHFNPPSAPHFGGLWEAAVRSAKIHLLKVLGENSASYEDMTTLLYQVECCLNSRPITPLSDDPNDLEPLTPGHFLVGTSLQELPEDDYKNIPTNRLRQWQQMQKLLQVFWARWRLEYLAQLQGRTKRWRPAVPIAVGQLVIIRDENSPPLRWKMGRVHELHPGDDGVVRVVTLKTAAGYSKRPVEKLCILPSAEQEAEVPPETSGEI